MYFKRLLVVIFCLFSTHCSFAQVKNDVTQSRILILLDESSSMIQKWPSGKQKYKAADELILRVMDSVYAINRNVEFSLRVFGHQHTIAEKNCYDTRNEVPFSKNNRLQMSLRLEDISPLGSTPIAYSLMQAAQYDLIDEEHNAYSIILITDGGESCGGDICEVMKKLLRYKVYFKPYIVSLEDDPALRTTYSCMGDYLQVTKDADMPVAVSTIVKAFRPLITITKADYTEIKTIAANTPSILNVEVPKIKVTESDNKKPVEKTIKPKVVVDTLPVVKAKDTVAKPVSKIKLDEPPVKLNQEHIAALTMSRNSLFYTPAPTLRNFTAANLPAVDIKVPPMGEEIGALPVASPKPFTVNQPVLKEVKAAGNLPTVNIVVRDEPEHIQGIAVSSPRPFSATPQSPVHAMATHSLPATEMNIPSTLSPDHMQSIAVSSPRPFSATPQSPVHAMATHSLPATEMNIPSTLSPDHINHLPISQPALLATTKPDLKTMKTVQPGNVQLPPIVIDSTPVAPKLAAEKMSRLPLASFRRVQTLFVIEEKSIAVPAKLPPLPPLKIDIPKPAVTKTTSKEPADNSKAAEYTVDREDAKETSLEIYLTNGKGKYYSSTPQMLVLEPGTGKVVKAFYRMVDPGGNPDAITNFPPGTYNIALSSRRSSEVKNVKIEPNKKTKITVIVKPCSLSFRYDKAPDRPVVEFTARVIERNKAQGKVTDQRCTERLEYNPGNYHIMISTYPQTDRNVDIDFDEEVITIDQPGFAKFVSDGSIKEIRLYDQEGDKFMYFSTLNVAEATQHPVRIQPGMYQVHYQKGTNKMTPETVISFLVKATEEVTVNLNK